MVISSGELNQEDNAMKIIYENKVKDMGECAEEFRSENMIVIFGDNAPPEIKDYCYWVDVTPINGTIAPGQVLKIGGESYKLTAVGDEAPVTLAGLGHCTFNFNGLTEVDLPGTIYVEHKPMPELKKGTVIQIVEE